MTFLILFCGLMTATDIPFIDEYPEHFFPVLIVVLAFCPVCLVLYTISKDLNSVRKARANMRGAVARGVGAARKLSTFAAGRSGGRADQAPPKAAGAAVHPEM